MRCTVSFLAASLVAGVALAEAPTPSWRASGFLTLGQTWVDSDAARGFARDQTQSQPRGWEVDSRLGLQLDGQLSPTLAATAQLVLRPRVPDTPAQQALEWAFLRWTPQPAWQWRLGRTNPDLFLYADVRSVGVAYPWVRPSQEMYAWMPLQSLDGLDLARVWETDEATWQLRAAFGQSRARLAAQDSGTPGDVRLQAVRTLTLSRDTPSTRLKLSYLRGRIDLHHAPVLATLDTALLQLIGQTQGGLPALAAEAETIRRGLAVSSPTQYLAAGAQHELGPWQLSAEWSRVWGQAQQTNARRWMLGAARRFDEWTAFTTLGRSRMEQAPLSAPLGWQAQLAPVLGPAPAAQLTALGVGAAQAGNLGRAEQHTWSVGARWDWRANLALKAQWDHVRVQPDGRSLWALRGPAPSGPFKARVFSLSLDASF